MQEFIALTHVPSGNILFIRRSSIVSYGAVNNPAHSNERTWIRYGNIDRTVSFQETLEELHVLLA